MPRLRALALAALTLSALLLAGAPAEAAKRIALVVGNSAYAYVTPLANPRRDAAALAEVLWQAGFEVIEVIDADLSEMQAAVAAFASRLEPGDVALFYYAGHAVQVRNLNLLLPVSVHPTDVDDLVEQSISAQAVLDLVGATGAGIKIALLDACRNNPFGALSAEQARAIAARGRALRGVSGPDADGVAAALRGETEAGLLEMSAVGGETVIGFATAPGEVAFDGAGANSPFTAALVRNLATPGIDLSTALGRVSADVRAATDGRQTSWTVSTLQSPFRFLPSLDDVRESTAGMSGAAPNVLGRLPPRRVVDAALWRAIAGSDDPAAFRGYLALLPDGAHAAAARARLDALGAAPPEPRLAFLPPIDPPPALPEAAALEPADATPGLAIGVGPAPLAALPTAAGGQWLHLRGDTRLGLVRLADGAALRGGDVAWLAAGEAVDYEPVSGSNGGREAIALDLLGAGGAREALDRPLEVWVHACDLLAGFEHDTRRVTAGARQFLVDQNPEAAIAVCEIAVRDYPDVPRFWAELARAYRSAGRYEEARDWYRKAADAGYMQAVVNLGQMHLDGQAVEKSTPRALELFNAAAAAEEPRAFTALAAVYRYGIGVPQDLPRALELQRRAAAMGVDWAMTNIAEHYRLGLGVAPDIDQALLWLTRAAKSGELTAQTRLARMHQTGDGVPVDYEKARFWFETAAGQNVPNAFTRLGLMHERGQGVPPDLDLALRYYGHAARAGDGEGMFRLGELYAAGRGVAKDPSVAARLYMASLETGVPGAERSLARLYAAGEGVARNETEALRLYAVAAETNPWAARDAGRLLLAGGQIARDPAAARDWLRKAAEGGVYLAALDLAGMERDGVAGPPDPVAAVVWAAVALAEAPAEAAEAKAAATALIDAAPEADRVAALQILLDRQGLDVGAPDGAAGPATRAALAALAERLGFAVDPAAPVDAALLARVARP